jgi:hypothetical protein
MSLQQMTKAYKILIAWSALALASAEALKQLPISDKATLLVGAVEIVLAVITGIAFGFVTVKNSR